MPTLEEFLKLSKSHHRLENLISFQVLNLSLNKLNERIFIAIMALKQPYSHLTHGVELIKKIQGVYALMMERSILKGYLSWLEINSNAKFHQIINEIHQRPNYQAIIENLEGEYVLFLQEIKSQTLKQIIDNLPVLFLSKVKIAACGVMRFPEVVTDDDNEMEIIVQCSQNVMHSIDILIHALDKLNLPKKKQEESDSFNLSLLMQEIQAEISADNPFLIKFQVIPEILKQLNTLSEGSEAGFNASNVILQMKKSPPCPEQTQAPLQAPLQASPQALSQAPSQASSSSESDSDLSSEGPTSEGTKRQSKNKR